METSLYPEVAQDVQVLSQIVLYKFHMWKTCSLDIFLSQNGLSKQIIVNNVMSLFLAVNQYFVILYLSKQIYMCKMNKFAGTKQTHGSPDHSPGIHQKLQHRQHHHLQTKLRNNAMLMTQKLSSKISNVVHFWETFRPKSLP